MARFLVGSGQAGWLVSMAMRAHQAGDVALDVVELPLGELVGGVDDGLARARTGGR